MTTWYSDYYISYVIILVSLCFRYFANEPFADLHRVEGLRGVFIATLINGSVSEDNMRSVITFDKGGTWELLQPPAADSLGGTLDCQVDWLVCKLPQHSTTCHLTQRWYLHFIGHRTASWSHSMSMYSRTNTHRCISHTIEVISLEMSVDIITTK